MRATLTSGNGTLLFVLDRGGYPLFSDELGQEGYDVLVASSTRKALSMLKSLTADVIVAEFNYGPRYGVMISNLEPLLSLVQTHCPNTKVITLLEKEHAAHLVRLQEQYPVFAALHYPLQKNELFEAIARAVA